MITKRLNLKPFVATKAMKGFFIFERGEDQMNAQGWIRGMIAKNYSSTEFLQLVVTTIQRQLQRWDETIDVVLYENMFDKNNFEIKIIEEGITYCIFLDKKKVSKLQKDWAFALDQFLWEQLISKGFTIRKSDGNYLTYCAI